MNNNYLKQGTSTPISKQVEELNKKIERQNEYQEKGIVSESEGYEPIIERKTEHKKSFKLQPKKVISMAFTTSSIIFALMSSQVKPSDVGYVFDYNVDNVSITQQDINDYTTKDYQIDTKDGGHGTLSFEYLDEKVPNDGEVHMVSVDEAHTPVGVTKNVEYPHIKGVLFAASMASLIGAAVSFKQKEEKNNLRR